MKNLKSMILSAVAALIVAAGPEAAAPLVGGDISAMAAAKGTKPAKKCKLPMTKTAKGSKLKNGKIAKVDTCELKKTKKPKACKSATGKIIPGATLVSKTKTLENGKTVTTNTCVKAGKKPAKPAKKCVAPQVMRKIGDVIGTDSVTGAPIKATKAGCVTPKP